MEVLLSAGDHTPSIPLFDRVGNGAKKLPSQMAGTCVKMAADETLISISSELLVTTAGSAHDAVLVNSQVITSPSLFVLLV